MKLKTITVDGKEYAVIEDGKPVYIHNDGKEVAFDAPNTVSTISRLNGEAQGHREAKEAAEAKLAAFKDIKDPTAAIAALEKVKKIDDKQLLDAGKVDEIKAAAIQAIEEKYKPIVAERDSLQAALHQEKIGGSFSRSKFIAEKIAVPADMIEAAFGRAFKIEDGKVVAYQGDKKVFSRARPGELADFDEALELLVEAYPSKDHILKGNNSNGTGAKPSNGAGTNGKTISRAEFAKLDPAAQMKSVTTDGLTVVD